MTDAYAPNGATDGYAPNGATGRFANISGSVGATQLYMLIGNI